MLTEEPSERRLDALHLQALRDEDEARDPRARGPAGKMPRRMDHVMDRVKRNGTGPSRDVQQSLEPQQLLAMRMDEERKPDREGRPRNWLIQHNCDACDAGGVLGIGRISNETRLLKLRSDSAQLFGTFYCEIIL